MKKKPAKKTSGGAPRRRRINSCEKGKVAEREASAKLRELGIWAIRGQQHAGGVDSPDLRHGVPGVHFEVKWEEAFRMKAALDQAEHDADGAVPVVLHRSNRRPWVVLVPLDRLLDLSACVINATRATPEPLPAEETDA